MIRIGIVGCGRILAAHLQGYRLLREAGVDDFRITALCARRADDARMYVRRGEGPPQRPPVGTAPGDPLAVGDQYLSDFQDDTDVKIFTDYREMAHYDGIDAVNDYTTHALHHQIADVALRNGKDLMTQKPLAVSVEAGRRMCQLAAEQNRVLGVFENARFRPDTRQLRWLFESGIIGQPTMVVMTNIGNWWAPDRIVAETPWRHVLAEGGGITLDIGVHLFHHLRYVLGEVTRVHATTRVCQSQRITLDEAGNERQRIECDADDTLMATFETEGQDAGPGAVGQIAASWSGVGGGVLTGGKRGVVYYGSEGRVVDDTVTLADGTNESLAELYQTRCDSERQQREFPLGLTDSFALNQLDWLTAVRQRSTPETSGEEGLRDLATAFSALESSKASQWVRLEDVLSGKIRTYQQPIDKRFGL